ncbi:MAG TPA: FtsX-like permease family protein [Kribbellaceae bacterium]|nr:FtsX-like permease family protein [Kribbellaceae bacterium]
MLYLSRRSVRHSWPLYAGAFVALALGVLLLGLAATTTAATVSYTDRHPGGLVVRVTGGDQPDRDVRYGGGADDVAGLQAVLSMVGAISGFVTIFVVASTFAFVVAARRRELGLLRLVGATPRQVRRMVRGEALTVAVLASLTGSVLAQLATPVLLDGVAGTELSPARLTPADPWLPLAITFGIGVLVALLGARAAARRAAKVPPVEALREAAVEPRRIGWLRGLAGVVFGAGGIAMLVFIRAESGEAAVPLAMFAPMVLVVALVALAPLVVPPLARLWALPLVRWTRVSGHLARGTVVASPRRTASLAAPILGMSAIAGSMVLTLSFLADMSYAALRDGFAAPVVVTGDRDLGAQLRTTAGVREIDASLPVHVVLTDRGDASGEDAEGIDPGSFTRARRLDPADAAALGGLTGDTVAVSKELSMFEGYRVGGTMRLAFLDGTAVTLRVVAVVDAAPEIVPMIMLPRELVAPHAERPERWFVTPADGTEPAGLATALDQRIGSGGDAVTTAEWVERSTAELRAGNRFGLLLLLGPAGLYAALTIANTLLMGSLQRRHEFVTTRLLGATPAQIRRTVLCESALVAAVALTLSAAISVAVGLLVRHAMAGPGTPMTVPWLSLAGIAAGCLAIAVVAALVPTAVMLRGTRPADAVAD